MKNSVIENDLKRIFFIIIIHYVKFTKAHALNITEFFIISGITNAAEYYGKYLGPLKSYHHGLGGDVYAVDAKTLHVRNFVYDGEGPGSHYIIHYSIHHYLLDLILFHNKLACSLYG